MRIVYFKNKPEMHENNMYLKLNIQFMRIEKKPLFWKHPIWIIKWTILKEFIELPYQMSFIIEPGNASTLWNSAIFSWYDNLLVWRDFTCTRNFINYIFLFLNFVKYITDCICVYTKNSIFNSSFRYVSVKLRINLFNFYIK